MTGRAGAIIAPKSGGLPDGFKRILVTGGGGFVGRRLVARFFAHRDESVQVMAPPRQTGANGHLAMDLESSASVHAVVKAFRPDLVIHLAGQSSVGASARADGAALTWRGNVLGALNLAEAVASKAPSATVLFSSSVEIYGAAFRTGRVDETAMPLPMNAYARSKLAAEQMLTDILPSETRLIIARPSNHSGAGQDRRFVIPAFASQVGHREIHVGNLEARRDFLHVEDVIDAYVALLAASPRLGSREVFNVASGQSVAIGFILERLMQLSGSEATVVSDPARLRASDIPSADVSADRIRSETGWHPARSLDEMLRDVLGSD